MRLIIGVLACVSVTVGAPSLSFAEPPVASPPPSTATTGAAQSSAPAPTQAQAAASPANAVTTPVKDDAAEADEKALIAAGFRPQMVRGEKLFCRSEPKLGTHFEQKRCGTVAQLKEETRNARELTENSQRHQTSRSGN